MKKVIMGFLFAGLLLGTAACNSANDLSTNSSSKESTSTEETTIDTSAEENEKMEEMQADLEEKGVEVLLNVSEGYLILSREKSIDYDYFEMWLIFSSQNGKIFEVSLKTKGNIDGKTKDTLYYGISNERIVESSIGKNTNIAPLAEILESLDYSDKEILEFAQWYYDEN